MDTINAPLPFLEMIANMAWQSRNAALNIAPLFIILVAVFGVVKFYLGQSGDKIDLNKYLFYNIFILLILLNYAWVIDTTGSLTRIITDVFPRHESDEMFKAISDAKIAENDYSMRGHQMDAIKRHDEIIKIAEEYNFKWYEKIYFKTQQFMDVGETTYSEMTKGGIDWLFSMLEVSFVRLVRAILELSRKVLLGFLIIVGPFALIFDMLPFMRGIASHWYKYFIAISLWLLTLNVLDAMYIGFAQANELHTAEALYNTDMSQHRESGYETFASQMEAGVGENGFLNLAMAIMYIMVPVLTTIYVGSGSGGEKLFGALWSGAMWAASKTGLGALGGGTRGVSAGGTIKGTITDKS